MQPALVAEHALWLRGAGEQQPMKLRILATAFLLTSLLAMPASARNYIVRTVATASAVDVCSRHGLTVVNYIDYRAGGAYLAAASDTRTPAQVIVEMDQDPEVVDIEEDKPVNLPEALAGATLN